MARRLTSLARRFPDDVGRVLFAHGERIMLRSKRDFVPVDNNALRSSGHVRPPQRGKGRLITVELVYGGTSAPYAISVHEHPSKFDPPSWQGATGGGRSGGFSGQVRFKVGGPKYLERPMMEEVPTLARSIANDLNLDKTARA